MKSVNGSIYNNGKVRSEADGGSRLKSVSRELEHALELCREGMSDVQKSYLLQREAKLLVDLGQYPGAVDVLSYAINLNHVVPFFILR